MAGTLENPVIGEKNEKGDPKIVALVKEFNELLDGSNKIPGTSLAAAAEILNAQLKGEITDAKLASPNNSFYRTLHTTQLPFKTGLVAGTYLMGTEGTARISGTNVQGLYMPYFHFVKADYEVAGKTQKLRLRTQIAVNATKPTIKFTLGLYPVTVAGGSEELKLSLGSVVTSSTVEMNEPAASTVTTKENSDFTIPSDGVYAIGLVTSGTMTAASSALLSAQLQTRSV